MHLQSVPVRTTVPQTRAGTPDSTAFDAAKEIALVKQASILLIDVEATVKAIQRLWTSQISVMLPDPDEPVKPLEGE